MEGAMTKLRSIHVLSVTQYEEEMSPFCLGLCSLALKGSPAPLHSCCLTSCQAPTKNRWNPLAGDLPVSVSCLPVSVL